jgi:hypothetical protein
LTSRSTDDGKTWSEPRRLLGGGNTKREIWNCPSLSRLKDGRLALLVDHCTQPHLQEKDRRIPSEVVMLESTDGGQTWSSSRDLPITGMVPDRLLEMKNGTWIISAHWKAPGNNALKLFQQMWRSPDQGATWEGPFVMAASPNYNFCEASVIEPKEGVLVAYLRENTGLGYPAYKSISYNYGESWECSETNIIACHRPKAGVLSDGSVLLTYRFYGGGASAGANTFMYRESINSCLCDNRLGQRGRITPMAADFNIHADGGYTGWVERPDGSVAVLNYARGNRSDACIYGFTLSREVLNAFAPDNSAHGDDPVTSGG